MTEQAVDEFYPGSRKRRGRPMASEFEPDPWREKFLTKTIKGKEVRLYYIGSLATALGIAVPTLREWIRLGYIPMEPYRLQPTMVVAGEKVGGRRLYTEEYIDTVVKVFRDHGILGKNRIYWNQHPEVTADIVSALTNLKMKDR